MARWIGTLVLLGFIGVGCAAQSAAEGPDAAAPAPTPAPDPITLELIMSDPEWIGRPPESPYWADDGSAVYFSQRRAGQSPSAQERDLLLAPLDAQPRVLSDAELPFADTPGGDRSADRTRKVYSRAGDLFVKDLTAGTVTQLTRTLEAETSPRFLAGDDRVAFRRADALFIRHLATGLEEQVPPALAEKDPDDTQDEKKEGLAAAELELFQHLRDRDEARKAARVRERQKRDADPTRVPKAFYLGDDVEVRSTDLSPTGQWLAVRLGPKRPDRPRQDSMPAYVTESGYVESRAVRAKVGSPTPTTDRLLLIRLADRARLEADLSTLPGITDDPLRQVKEEAKAWRQARSNADPEAAQPTTPAEPPPGEPGPPPAAEPSPPASDPAPPAPPQAEQSPPQETPAPPQPRPVRISSLQWTEDGSRLAFQVFSADNKDRWVAVAELPTPDPVAASAADGVEPPPEGAGPDAPSKPPAPGSLPFHVVVREQNAAWINTGFCDLGWLRDHRRLWFLSEESGHSNLHLFDAVSKERRPLVTGPFEVSGVSQDRAGRFLYFTCNHTHPGVHEFCRADADSGAFEQLTDLRGRVADASLSPDESRILLSHSQALRPRELFVQDNRPGAPARRLTFTVSERFTSLPWVAPEFVVIPGPAGPVHARVYDAGPAGPADPPPPRPAVLFIHGAGYLQNAHQGWSQYFREFMFHSLLARRGYVVLDMDYRASAGYGRDWRTAIYRNMGPPELDDLQAGVDWLVAHRHVDRARVGVYGGSYGGFLTLMALFTRPDLFACGAALRPVTDWAHYSDGYTANILNTPDDDPVAYERSSPIRHAAGLATPLLICHGMQDDNVFFQDTVRLTQRLIELGKENWEVAPYPVEPHAFTEPASWLDQYRRVLRLFEENLDP